MPHEKIRKVREGVQQRKQAVAERRERARFGLALKASKVREAGPVKEAKATKRELKMLGKEVGEPVVGVARKAASGAEAVRRSVRDLEGSLDTVQQIEGDTLAEFETDSFELVSGRPTRPASGDVRELTRSGVEKGVKAGDTAFENRVKRRTKKERLESLIAAEPDDFGMAGDDFDIDLEVIDDLERGEEGGMGELGFDTAFDADDEPGVGILGEFDPDDLEVIGEEDR